MLTVESNIILGITIREKTESCNNLVMTDTVHCIFLLLL